MSTHTPGPWFIWTGPSESCKDFGIGAPDDSVVCSVHSHPHPCAKANARLIAAAPELLEACKALHDALSDIVEGENNTFGSYELCNADRDASMAAFDLSFAAIAKAEGGAA